MISPCHRPLVGALLACIAASATAGRPLATDDAATADAERCQVEAWLARGQDDRTYVLAGACGVAQGIEVGVEATRTSPRQGAAVDAGLALKWAPAAATFDTALGELRLGAKAAPVATRPSSGDWDLSGFGVLALASLALGPAAAVHLNLGPQRDLEAHRTFTRLNAAVTWVPVDAALLFGEVQAADSRALGGPVVRTAGARWWLAKDTFGVDLTASRTAGSNDTQWSIGFGWYGFGL